MGCGQSKPAVAETAAGAPKGEEKKKKDDDFVHAAIEKVTEAVEKMGDAVEKMGDAVTDMFREPTSALKGFTKDGLRNVRNVFAIHLDLEGYQLPVFEKSEEEKDMITKALKGNFVFEHLSSRERKPLVQAFEKISVPEKEEIIKQGDEGNFFYVIAKGTCSFEVDGKEVGQAKEGNSFGELALLCKLF
jgi:hypothetical protein